MLEGLEGIIRLSGHAESDFAVLAAHAERVRPWIDAFVSEFYDTLYAQPETAAVFRPNERPERERTLADWLHEIASGRFRDDFWRRQWIVGLVHVKRHVETAWVVAIMGRLQLRFLERALAELERPAALELFAAFKRASDVVVALVAQGFHRGYREAVADVSGMSPALIDRMADVAVDKLLRRARG